MYKVVAIFSNGRTSEHVFPALDQATFCARNIEAGSFAEVTIYQAS